MRRRHDLFRGWLSSSTQKDIPRKMRRKGLPSVMFSGAMLVFNTFFRAEKWWKQYVPLEKLEARKHFNMFQPFWSEGKVTFQYHGVSFGWEEVQCSALLRGSAHLKRWESKCWAVFNVRKLKNGHNVAGLGVDFPTIAILSKGTPPLVFVYIGEIQTMK